MDADVLVETRQETAGFQVEMPRCEPDHHGGGWVADGGKTRTGGSDAVPDRRPPTHIHPHTTPGWAGLGGKVTSAVRGSTV